MADVGDALNLTVDREWAGRTWKVRRLTLSETWGALEGEVRRRHLASVSAIAASLTGKDKIDFLAQAARTAPAGEELTRQMDELISGYDGIKLILQAGLAVHNKLAPGEIDKRLTKETLAEGSMLTAWLLGDEPATQPAAEGAAEGNAAAEVAPT